MISLEQISGEIAALEAEKPTHLLMQKLAALYTVRDHLVIGEPNTVDVVPPLMSESEFAKAIEGKGITAVVSAMDELMQALEMVNPKLYNATIEKISRTF